MIKKLLSYSFRIVLCFLMLVPYFIEPFSVQAKSTANTIAELKQELQKLKDQRTKNNNDKKKTQSEINANKQEVINARNEQNNIAKSVEDAEIKIQESNTNIEKSKNDMDVILKYYQLSSNQNEYLEYIMGASTPTDFIMRIEAVSQITSYYHDKIEKLNNMIKENEQLKIDLANKYEQLDEQIEKTSTAISKLNGYLSEINDINEDIDSQIANQEKLINYYKTVCSSETQQLSTCVSVAASSGWLKPLVKGKVTSGRGNRDLALNSSNYHNAFDIGGNPEGTPIYSTSAGTVAAISNGKASWERTGVKSCGGIMIYVHVNINGKPYTVQYAHLLTYNVKVGDKLTADSIIGTVGGGAQETKWDRCSTGAHLHYGVSTGYYLGGGANGYSSWSTFIARSIDPPGIPRNSWWYSRY